LFHHLNALLQLIRVSFLKYSHLLEALNSIKLLFFHVVINIIENALKIKKSKD